MNRLILIISLTLGIGGSPAFAQTEWILKRDSLLKALSHDKDDTNRVWTLERLGEHYIGVLLDSTGYYADAYYQLSRKLNYPVGMVSGLSMKAMYVGNHMLKVDQAIALDMEAIEIGKRYHMKKALANVYNTVANIYKERKEDYSTAIAYYLKALDIFEKLPDSGLMAMTYCNIALTYSSLQEYKKSYQYSLRGLTIFQSLKLERATRGGMLGLASALIGMKRYDTALTVLSAARIMADQWNDRDYQQDILIRQIRIYTSTRRLPQLRQAATRLMAIAESLSANSLYTAWGGLSDYYYYKRDYKTASTFNDSLINETKLDSAIGDLGIAYERMGKIELAKGNLVLYDRYKELHDSIEDVLLSDKILKNTQELETKYSLDKKQAQIDRLNDQEKIDALTLREHQRTIWVLFGVIAAFAVFAFLFYSNSRHKKRLLLSEAALQQQKITELEKERQLLATRSVLLGQDEERKRLAKDLHDGLGGILSVAKYSFNNMKQNLIITPENALAFDKSMGYLDRSIQELRRVAHNMMPEALIEFGLDTALRDYCNSITNSGVLQLGYHSFDLTDGSVPPTTASVIYRIIQELINNILKHAAATTAAVQLVKRSDALSITVEDNGKGFDLDTLKNAAGIGYLNLQNRVSYLQGTLDVQPAPGKGTYVSIEIPNIAK